MGRYSNNFTFETILITKDEKKLVPNTIINYYKRHKSISYDKALEIQTKIKRPLESIFIGANRQLLNEVDAAQKAINETSATLEVNQ
jgi:hypothetical protein